MKEKRFNKIQRDRKSRAHCRNSNWRDREDRQQIVVERYFQSGEDQSNRGEKGGGIEINKKNRGISLGNNSDVGNAAGKENPQSGSS